jgi:HK97 family phage major capsid protein
MEARDTTGGSKIKKEQRADKVSQMEAIISKAQKDNSRSLTKDEAGQWEQLYSEVKELSKELEAEQEKEEREVFNIIKNYNRSEEMQPTEWRDKNGNAVPVYRSNERLSDSNTAEENKLSIGRAIQGLVTGDFSHCPDERRALDTVSGSGSIVVPKVLSNRVIDMARAKSVMIQAGMATVPMSSNNLTLVKVSGDVDNIHFKAENDKFNDSGIVFSPIELKSFTCGSTIALSNELMADSPAAAAAIESAIASAVAARIDETCIFGTGVNQPKGMNLYTDLQQIAVNGTLADYNNFISAMALVMGENVEPDAYITNSRVWASLSTLLAQSDGHYMNMPPALAKLKQLVSSRIPFNGGVGSNESSVFLGAFQQNAVLGLRQDISVEISQSAGEAFERNQTIIRAVTRFDFGLLHPEQVVKISGIIA